MKYTDQNPVAMFSLPTSVWVFIAVVETRSFTKAGVRAKMTQPAVSNQMANLEKSAGVRLFDRDQKTTPTLTEAGRLLYTEYVKIVKMFEKTSKQLSEVVSEGVDKTYTFDQLNRFSQHNALEGIRSSLEYNQLEEHTTDVRYNYAGEPES